MNAWRSQTSRNYEAMLEAQVLRLEALAVQQMPQTIPNESSLPTASVSRRDGFREDRAASASDPRGLSAPTGSVPQPTPNLRSESR